MSAMIAIFTFGLGEDSEGSMSAYSVFNRGYQALMGSVDADALVQQHVGGAMGAIGGGGGLPHDRMNELAHNEVPRRRVGANNPAPLRNDVNERQNNHNEHHDDEQNRARQSGKKARRRNLEERRELQRQRQAAINMGFNGGDQAEALAMQRILEEQVALNQE